MQSQGIVAALRGGGYRPLWKRVESAGTLTFALGDPNWSWDVVTCDGSMPGLRLESALPIVRALAPRTPIIALSDGIDPASIDRLDIPEAVLSRDRLDDLPLVIARVLGVRRGYAPFTLPDTVDRPYRTAR
jgi:DNA-binding NarL/FixJ family response regulator